mmetsp:Transcript_227/g.428  ORF Transcript_227/g.428 Transcript_227/m.428 type:complete len:168 (-) Transcript_227:117-620(-)
MNLTLADGGSSFFEEAPDIELGKRAAVIREVRILPIDDVVRTNVFLFKLHVQGFEYEVLSGAQALFQNYNVKTILMEVYPRGLRNAGTNFLEFLNYIWNDLGMMCSSSNPPAGTAGWINPGFEYDYPSLIPDFAEYMEGLSVAEDTKKGYGRFDDFYCFNWKKIWKD